MRRESRTRAVAEDLTTGSMLMAAAAGEAPARAVRTLLRDRTFAPYFWGQALATMGVWIHNVAAAILMWELTRSTQWVAAITVGQFLPQMAIAPWSGARADRADRRRQMVTGTLIAGSGPALIATWEAAVGFDGAAGPTVLVLAATVIGIGFAVGGPATQALLPSLVRRTELPSVVAVSSWPMTVARAAGPALGAVLMVASGPAVTFALVATTQFTFAAVMHRRDRELLAPADGRDTRVRAALTYLRAERPTAFLLVGVAVVGSRRPTSRCCPARRGPPPGRPCARRGSRRCPRWPRSTPLPACPACGTPSSRRSSTRPEPVSPRRSPTGGAASRPSRCPVPTSRSTSTWRTRDPGTAAARTSGVRSSPTAPEPAW